MRGRCGRIGTGGRASYTFRSSWTVDAPRERVREVLADLGRYPQWWPQIRAVASLGEREALVVAKSVLPYTLDLHLTLLARDEERLEVRIDGDMAGVARWLLADQGTGTRLDFEQDVTIGGWFARATPLLRPLLEWNHDRMMAGCRDGLARTVTAPR